MLGVTTAAQPHINRPTPVSVLNNFTWPNPAERFTFEADADESGDDLKRRLAAHIGYLAIDMMVVRVEGEKLEGDKKLADQGVKAGESLRIARKSSLPAGAGTSDMALLNAVVAGATATQRAAALTALSSAALKTQRAGS